jgi:hypothetical protein
MQNARKNVTVRERTPETQPLAAIICRARHFLSLVMVMNPNSALVPQKLRVAPKKLIQDIVAAASPALRLEQGEGKKYAGVSASVFSGIT